MTSMFIVNTLLCLLISTSLASDVMPSCDSKETCNELWSAPSVSDCVGGTCQCIGGSVYYEKNKTCICQEGHVIGSKRCISITASLGSTCDEDVQCTRMGDSAVCVNYQCVCKTGTTAVNGLCQPKRFIGDACDYNDECQHVQESICRDKTCTCNEGFVPTTDGKSCLTLLRNFWSPCEDDIQCHGSFGEGSRCITKCVCKNDYHKVANDTFTKCVRNKGIGDSCSSNDDCYLDSDIYGARVQCLLGTCTYPGTNGAPTPLVFSLLAQFLLVIIISVLTL